MNTETRYGWSLYVYADPFGDDCGDGATVVVSNSSSLYYLTPDEARAFAADLVAAAARDDDRPRYMGAAEDECGLMYRPGEMAIESLNYCRLAAGHPGHTHSTRMHEHDIGGFDWDAKPDPNALRWPARPA